MTTVDLSGGTTFQDYVTGIIDLFNTVAVPVIFALAFAVFVWGAANYFILHGGDETKRAEGRQFALWGIIGMAVLFSVWGFVSLLLSTLGITPH
jgi:hypothetical protein